MIDAYASAVHYAEHLLPVWRSLPAAVMGAAYGPRQAWWGEPLTRQAMLSDRPVIVASLLDAMKMRGRRLIYVEHGAGQTYRADVRSASHGSYSGGDGLDDVVLFLCPSQRVADNWTARYPDTPAVVVGCPKLDVHRDRGHVEPVAVVSFHWDCPLVPETRSAMRFWMEHLPALRDRCGAAGVELVGSGHPRAWRTLGPLYGRTGVRTWPHSGQVLQRALLLIADNTSLMYEMAAVGRPVVALNAPWYRRGVEHGLRFWSHVPGPQADNLDGLFDAVDQALTRPDSLEGLRSAAVAEAYGFNDGEASARAAAAVTAHVSW